MTENQSQDRRDLLKEHKQRQRRAEIRRTVAEGHHKYALKIAVEYDMVDCLSDLEIRKAKKEMTEAEESAMTPEFRKKAKITKVNFKRSARRAKRNADTTIFDTYFYTGLLTWRQYRAAELYWQSWYFGGMDPRVTASYSNTGGSRSGDEMPHSLFAMQNRDITDRLNKRLGDRLRKLVVFVVCHNQPANQYGLTIGKSKRSSDAGMELFRESLEMIADELSLPDKQTKMEDLEEPVDE